MSGKTVYHLTAPDGRHFYMLGHGSWLADGQPMEQLTRVRHDSSWYVVATEPAVIARKLPDRYRVVSWELKDPETESKRFPLTLTHVDYNERTDSGDDGDAPECGMYRSVGETTPGGSEPIDMAAIVHLDGEPAPADGRTWVAKLPYELSNHVELLHLFPGRLSGFRGAVIEAVRQRLGVGEYTGWLSAKGSCGEAYQRSGYITAKLKVPYSPRQTEFVHDRSRSTGKELKGGRNAERTVALEVTVAVADSIEGKTRAEAALRWDEMLPRLVEEIAAELEPAVCWHCKGKGVVRQSEIAKQGAIV